MDNIQLIAVYITSGTVILGALYSMMKVMRRIDSAIGLDKEGRSISDRMSRVEHQLWPNGGSSLMDKVNNLDANYSHMAGELSVISGIIQKQAASK